MGYTPPPLVDEIVKKWDEAQGHHATFVRHYERNERAYRGVLSVASDAAKWRHKNHPPYAFNLIETIVSNMIEMGLRFDVRPAPQVGLSLDEATQQLEQAESVGHLLRHEHRIDEFDYKQRPFYLSAAIGGIGILKDYWNQTEGAVQRYGYVDAPVHDDEGNEILRVPVIREIAEKGLLRDHSTTEVVDPRDFVLHESARALQPWEPGGAQYLFHRCWYSFEQLKMFERAGFFSNVDRLKESIDFSGEYADRETELWNINRAKDLIEVLEYWTFEDGKVKRAYVGNRGVQLRDKESNPFWHGQYPFIIGSSMPQLFTTRGMSDIELIAELQEILWELGNQRLDNVELVNNFIMLVRPDVDDPEAFEWYPGARWPVDDPAQAQPMMPPFQLTEASLHAEALLKGDLQNVTSAAPFASGAETATVDQKTATGASIVMNAAQQRLVAKKYQAQQALYREANMRIKNCQQFMSPYRSRLVHIIGEDGATSFLELNPLDIQGEWAVEMRPMGDSQMRQERRAEATQWLQVLSQIAPLAAASQTPLNVREMIGWAAKKWDIEDWERFFSRQPAALGAANVAGGASGAAPAEGPEGPNLGVTAETAVDASSPSATGGLSMSPEVMMQRALAMSGGSQNVV